jgi:hypothetical protein
MTNVDDQSNQDALLLGIFKSVFFACGDLRFNAE